MGLKCKIGGGELFYNAGCIRNTPVSIGGTKWKPDKPIESQIKEQLLDIIKKIVSRKQTKPLH